MNVARVVAGLVGASLALVALLAVGSCARGPQSAGPGPSRAAEPSASTTMQPCFDDVEDGGLPITRVGGVSSYGAAPNQRSARSENIWSTSSTCSKLVIGQRVVYSFDIQPQLGPTGYSVWQTVSQLQGPTTNGTWLGPPVALVVESGQWRVSGGYLAANGRGGLRRDFGYTKYLSQVRAGTWQHWTFDVLLSGPGTGSVTAWLDGKIVVDGLKPAGGTMYTTGGGYSHQYLQLKTGQYTGSDDIADLPTWRRLVLVKNVRLSIVSPRRTGPSVPGPLRPLGH
ncbi:MAG: heparin lyase I family protein [Dermatophilaceae bacterium]